MNEELKEALLAAIKLLRSHEERIVRLRKAVDVLQHAAVSGDEAVLRELEQSEDKAVSDQQVAEELARVDAIIDLLGQVKSS